MNILTDLNKTQCEAVQAITGPVMVIAGAGSGKTRVLTYRLAYLIDNGIPASNILAVTFTNKAAREMADRVKVLFPNGESEGATLCTFHSLGAKILRKYASIFGYQPNFTILDDEDSLAYIKQAIHNLNLDSKEYRPRVFHDYVSKIKNKDPLPDDMSDDFKENAYRIKDAYQNLLLRESLMDFDDLLLLMEKLFEDRPDVLNAYQEKFQYIMVDEFQDTNTIQFHIVEMLAQKYRNIFIVGDQDQSIYSFRGAKYENIALFQKRFPEAITIKLEQNYRSTPEILNVANAVIQNNHSRIPKTLISVSPKGQKPTYFRAKSSFEETLYVAEKIKALHTQGIPYSEMAVLYRSNALSRNFEDTLLSYKIPYVIYGGLSFFSRMEVKDLVAYLRIILNHNDNFSFKRVVNVPKRGIGKESLNKLEMYALEQGLSLFDAVDSFPSKGKAKEGLLSFKKIILELDSILDTTNLNYFIDEIVNRTNYEAYLKQEYEELSEDKMENISEFKSVIFESKEYHGKIQNREILTLLLEDLALRTDQDKNITQVDSVILSTYHQVKGLEFKVVFMVAMENGIFPNNRCIFSDYEMQEERRVCYVGITRAKSNLFFTNAISRLHYGETQQFSKSQFLTEIPVDMLRILGENKEAYKNLPNSKYAGPVKSEYQQFKERVRPIEKPSNQNQYGLGTKIMHKTFGLGVVVKETDETITVAFNQSFGIRTLAKNHPSISLLQGGTTHES